jgi:hypothetical protein
LRSCSVEAVLLRDLTSVLLAQTLHRIVENLVVELVPGDAPECTRRASDCERCRREGRRQISEGVVDHAGCLSQVARTRRVVAEHAASQP